MNIRIAGSLAGPTEIRAKFFSIDKTELLNAGPHNRDLSRQLTKVSADSAALTGPARAQHLTTQFSGLAVLLGWIQRRASILIPRRYATPLTKRSGLLYLTSVAAE